MERLNEALSHRPVLLAEHKSRYELAAALVSGDVVDCACGMGYASEIISPRAGSYLGVDVDETTINQALKTYSEPGVDFLCCSIDDLYQLDRRFDTFLCFETLEHCTEVPNTLASIRGCLKDDGLLIGSVPTADYEELCEQTYGKNEFHLHRFGRLRLEGLLREHFDFVMVCTLVVEIVNTLTVDSHNAEYHRARGGGELGSYFFICATREDTYDNARGKLSNTSIHPVSLPEHDRRTVGQIRDLRMALTNAERLALERYDLLQQQTLAAKARRFLRKWSGRYGRTTSV